jgi:hypothetical protein
MFGKRRGYADVKPRGYAGVIRLRLLPAKRWAIDWLGTPVAIGGGCGAGRACVPKPSSIEWGICPYQAREVDGKPLSASVACPQDCANSVVSDGRAPLVASVATNWDESGACTPCDCEPDPVAACADATLTLYSDSNCQSSVGAVGPGECALVGTSILSAQYNATPVHAGCTSSGSEPRA